MVIKLGFRYHRWQSLLVLSLRLNEGKMSRQKENHFVGEHGYFGVNEWGGIFLYSDWTRPESSCHFQPAFWWLGTHRPLSLGFLSSRGVPDPQPHPLLQRWAPELMKVGKIINTFKVLSATLMILRMKGGALGKFGGRQEGPPVGNLRL